MSLPKWHYANISASCHELVTSAVTQALEDAAGLMEKRSKAHLSPLSVTFLIVPLMMSLAVGSMLRHYHIRALSVAGAALMIGVATGLVVKTMVHTHGHHFIIFSQNFFFLGLLPPICFEAGWSIKKRPFFRNFDIICALAFVGTTISTLVVGFLMILGDRVGIVPRMRPLHHMLFGAIISATDPVTTLSVFGEVGANDDLFAIVFGESILNDAAAIVLYRTLLFFRREPFTTYSFAEGVGLFLIVFCGSTFIGTAVALLSALVFRTGAFRTLPGDEGNPLEASLACLFPYVAYTLADGLNLSGIVSVLWCGIVMGHYTRLNMSEAAERWAESFFKLIASLAELFVFVYMGTSVFLVKETFKKPGHLLFAVIGCLAGRFVHVYPICGFFNRYLREPRRRINMRFQHMIMYSGLRGAVAFALAIGTAWDINKEDGAIIMSSTVFMVLFTVIIFGGSTFSVLEKLRLRAADTAPEAWAEPQSAHEAAVYINALATPTKPGPPSGLPTPSSSNPMRIFLQPVGGGNATVSGLKRRLEEALNFQTLDREVFTPLFVNPVYAAEQRVRYRIDHSHGASGISRETSSRLDLVSHDSIPVGPGGTAPDPTSASPLTIRPSHTGAGGQAAQAQAQAGGAPLPPLTIQPLDLNKLPDGGNRAAPGAPGSNPAETSKILPLAAKGAPVTGLGNQDDATSTSVAGTGNLRSRASMPPTG